MAREWWFLAGLIVLVTVAWRLLTLPFGKKAKWLAYPVFLLGVSVLYSLSGDFKNWHQHEAKLRQFAVVKKELARYKTADGIIEKLKSRLKDDPASAKGWYLLGKIYLNQGQFANARDALSKAMTLAPNKEAIQVHYLLSLWECQKRHFDETSRRLLAKLLKSSPKEPNTLVLAAREALERGNQKAAIRYWQTLLTLVPPDSQEARFLQKAIGNLTE